MELDFLQEYFVPAVAGVCLCVGFVVKLWTPADRRLIPTLCGLLGIVLAVWNAGWAFTPQTVLTGLVSGLGSTGLYEAFKNLLEKGVTK